VTSTGPGTGSLSTRWHDLLRFSVLSFIGGLVAEQVGRGREWLGLLLLVLTLAVGAGVMSSGVVARRDAGPAAPERRTATWRITTGALCAVAAIAGFALSRLASP
jgi:hypothetical protein